MNKIFKFFFKAFIPFLLILFLLMSANVIIKDWKYAHKSLATHQAPFNWVLYNFEIGLIKFIKNFYVKSDIGLPIVKLYISEKFQKKLLSDTPKSTKEWQKAFLLLNNDLKEIKIRHRGDNPRNWFLEKKHWRIKTKKSELLGRYRYYNYIPYNLERYISGKIAQEIGLLIPKNNLVELFINDISNGIYIETEHLNENYLRRNKMMPVNLYKGEQILSEIVVASDRDLFSNHNVWSKVAYFNNVEHDNKDDLIFILNLLRKSETQNDSLNNLFNKIDMNEWAKFSAYQILTQNYHNDFSHNMRLIIDPWSGLIRPIAYDPIISSNIHQGELLNLEKSSHNLLLMLNKNTFFINEKYKELYKLITEEKIFDKVLITFQNLEKKISISENRDIEITRHFLKNINWTKSIKKKKIFSHSGNYYRSVLSNNLYNHEKKILKSFFSQPIASWYFEKNLIEINIDGNFPVSNIIIKYDKSVPKYIYVDLNNDGFFNDEEKFFPDEFGQFMFPITIYANRTAIAKKTKDLIIPEIVTSNTKFIFLTENLTKPHSIIAENPFTKENFTLKQMETKSVLPNKYNLPIKINSKNDQNIKIFSGIININKNLIVKDKIIIEPGTKFRLSENSSIIFQNQVLANGTIDKPIIFESLLSSYDNQWGTIALLGQKTKGSKFKNVVFNGGSGGLVNQIHYTAMFSLHSTSNIILENIIMKNNFKYDDMLHLVYCNDVEINNILIEDAFGDAIDIDISTNIVIKNSNLLNPRNDSIDLMESIVLIDSSLIVNSGDKGISVGENSKALVYNSYLIKNLIGIAVKDKSTVDVMHTDLEDNKLQISSYQKNWQYGDGGAVDIFKSNFVSRENNLKTDNKSSINVFDSSFIGIVNKNGSKIYFDNNNNYNGNKVSVDNSITKKSYHPLYAYVKNVKNNNMRGSDFLNKE